MEQVLRTVNALNEHGFTGIRFASYQFRLPVVSSANSRHADPAFPFLRFLEITMYETLMRPHEASQIPSLKSVHQAGEELKDMAVRREERRLRQIASSAASRAKRKREEAGDGPDLDEAQEGSSLKRIKADEGEGDGISTAKVGAGIRKGDDDHDGSVNSNGGTNLNFATDPEAATDPIECPDGLAGEGTRPNMSVGHDGVNESNSISGDGGSGGHLNVSRVFPEVRGHTSYLTFACLVPFHSDATPRNSTE